MPRRALALTIAALAILGGACSSDSDTPSAAPTTVAPTTTTTLVELDSITVDWTNTVETPLPNGWVIRDCGEGARTNICIYDGAEFLGDIELLAGYPLDPRDDVTKPAQVALAWAQRMIEHFRADRANGCSAFTFKALEPTPANVGGEDGARGGFTLADPEGRIVERVINHYVVANGRMTIINADAYALDGGCLPPSEDDPSFTPEHLSQLDDGTLGRIIAASEVTAS